MNFWAGGVRGAQQELDRVSAALLERESLDGEAFHRLLTGGGEVTVAGAI
jgi:hypothetical protein